MKKVEYVSMRNLKQTLPYLTVSLTILYIFMRIYKSYNPFAFPGIEERISLILVPCLFLTLIFYFPVQRMVNLLKVLLNILREKVSMPKPTFIQKRAWFDVFKLKIPEKFDTREIISPESYQKALIKYLFLVFLIIIALLEIAPISKYLSFLTNFKTHLFVLTIVLGVVTFWQNREVIAEVEKDANEEEKQEEKRKTEFSKKYPRINGIPIVRNIVRWMYKEGWGYSTSLIILLLVAFSLRILCVGKLALWFDEINQLIGTLGILETGIPITKTGFLYLRGVPYSYISAPLVMLLGKNEFILRLPSVIMGVLVIIYSYLLGKKAFNKNIGMIFSFLMVFNTWCIEFSRYSRGYILLQLLFVMLLYYFLKFLEEPTKKKIIITCILSILIIFTHQLGTLFFIPIFIYWIFNINKKNLNKKYIVFMLFFIGIGIVSFLSLLINELNKPPATSSWAFIPTRIYSYSFYFLKNIYSYYPTIVYLTMLGLIVFILFEKKKKHNTLIYLSLLMLLPLGFIRNQLRYLFFLFPLFVLISAKVAINISALFESQFRKKMISILLITFLLVSLNAYMIPSIYQRDYGETINDESISVSSAAKVYPDNKYPILYVKEHKEESDIVISTNPKFHEFYLEESIYYWLNNKWLCYYVPPDQMDTCDHPKESIDYYDKYLGISFIVSDEQLKKIINSNERVWIVTTNTKNNKNIFGNKIKNFLDSNKEKVVFVGKDDISKVYLFR